MTHQIIGAFGGGGSAPVQQAPSAPKIEADNLESAQFARIVDLISEGEIEGFAAQKDYTPGTQAWENAALKSIFFNNTPVMRSGANPSATLTRSDLNFDYQSIAFRLGTQDQTYLSEIGTSTQAENAVNVELVPNTPITRSITNADVDGVRVTVSVPQLFVTNFNGDVQGSWVDVTISVSYDGATFTSVLTDRIGGRTADLYQRKYLINLTQAAPVDVRLEVTNRRPDGDVAQNANTVYWASYTELIYEKTTYPNSALVGMRIGAEQFSSVPTRAYHIRGIKVRIPDNATVDNETGRLIYSGTWSGTFQAAKWCSDPAWILYDLLTSKRYGFGDYVDEAQLDKWAFLSSSIYASELVPDGFGGQEPRFSCNVNIQTSQEAFKLINDLCSVFRAQPYWSTGALTLAQDSPTDASYVFNQANVTAEGFTYSGSSVKTRHTVAVVSYFDIATREKAYEVVEDAAGIKKFGVVKTEVEAFACTSRGQARRVGEWLLYSETYETEVISFATGPAEGLIVRPGTVIRVSDPVRQGRFRAGRITGGTDTSVTLDRSATDLFPDGLPTTLDFNVVLPDGTSQSVGSIPGTNLSGNTLTLTETLRLTPIPGLPWSIGISTLRPELWRVLTVQEQGDQIVITGLLHKTDKYDYVERDVPLQRRDVTSFDNEPQAPANINAVEYLYESNGQVLNQIVLSWQSHPDAAQTELSYRLNNGNWTTIKTRSPDYTILQAEPGAYEFELQAISPGLKRSNVATYAFTSVGKTAPPQTIPDLFIAPIDQHTAELYWPQAVDLDVRIGGQVRIRHTPVIGASAVWARSNDVVPAVNGSSTRKIVPLLEGTYFIRAVDSTGNESDGTASVVVDLPEPQDLFLVQEYREEDDTPPFQGTGTNLAYSTDESALILSASGLIDDIADWDTDVTSLDFYGDTNLTGSYEFLSTLDLGAKYDLELLQILKSRAFVPNDYWDSRTGLVDTWADIDGADISNVNAELYVRTTNDDPSGSPTWGLWQPFANGTTRGRGFQFKVEASTVDPSQNIAIEELGVTTRLQRRTEQERNISSGASSYTVTFPTPFYGTPSVGITVQDSNQGDYFTLSSISRTGFTVTHRDSGGSIVSRTFDYQAVGHGREIT